MRTPARIAIILLTLLGCVGCDQATKLMARDHLPPGQTLSMLGDTFRLVYAENPGAFLSIGHTLPEPARRALFTYGAIAFGIAALFWAVRSRQLRTAQTVGLALMCGGALGNVIDRLSDDGRVIDFLNLGIGQVRTGIFNVADMALLAGVALVVLAGRDRHARA